MNVNLGIHLVQTKEWGEFKTAMGTKAVRVDDVQFTKHRIPFLHYYIGYAPRVNFFKQKFDWGKLSQVARREKCAVIRFDVPNVLAKKQYGFSEKRILDNVESHCVKSPRSTFAQHNVLLNLSLPIDELFSNLNPKTRYNIRLSERKGVEVRIKHGSDAIDEFNELHRETARRDRFLRHPDKYYRGVYEAFAKNKKAFVLTAYYKGKPLASWMLFTNDGTLYYPYGSSSSEYRNYMASNLLAWEAIKLGKRLNCKIFDMWGATNDENSDWWGFTRFKLGYGGELVKYIDSCDLIINPLITKYFDFAYSSFWNVRNVVKKIYR